MIHQKYEKAGVDFSRGPGYWALLNGDMELGQAVVDGDRHIDDLTLSSSLIWARIEADGFDHGTLRQLVGTLMLLPELERSADLAEHIAERALTNVGADMTPMVAASSRGCPKRQRLCRPLRAPTPAPTRRCSSSTRLTRSWTSSTIA